MTKMEDPKIQLLKMIFSFNIVPRGVAVKGLLAHWELKSSKDGMMHTIYLRYSLWFCAECKTAPLSSL